MRPRDLLLRCDLCGLCASATAYRGKRIALTLPTRGGRHLNCGGLFEAIDPGSICD